MIVREAINNFQRGGDPRKTMKIGLAETIKNWFRESYDSEPIEDELIYDIFNDDELDLETKKKWTEYLLGTGIDWNYESWYEMDQNHIKLENFLPNGWKKDFNDLTAIKFANNFFITFSDWAGWADFFEKDSNRDEDFLSDLLGGDAWKYFETYNNHEDLDNISYFLNDNRNKLRSLTYLTEIYEEMGGEEVELDLMLEEIWENGELEPLKDAISIAADGTQASAEEHAAYKLAIKSLGDYYEISNGDWDDTKEEYKVKISPDGLNRLVAVYFKEDDGAGFVPPNYGFQADWSPDTFDEELNNQLENLSR